jgi:hypothetical protein
MRSRDQSPFSSITNSMFTRISESRANRSSYVLDNLDIDGATRDILQGELQRSAQELAMLMEQSRQGEISAADLSRLVAENSEENLLSRHLDSAQMEQYRELNRNNQDNMRLYSSMVQVSASAGPMSESSRDLLAEGLSAMQDRPLFRPGMTPDQNRALQMENLQRLEEWYFTQIPEQDFLGATVFFESQKNRLMQ